MGTKGGGTGVWLNCHSDSVGGAGMVHGVGGIGNVGGIGGTHSVANRGHGLRLVHGRGHLALWRDR